MLDLSKLGLAGFDLSVLPPSILGRLSFVHGAPGMPPLPPGRHALGVADERDALLIVPPDLAHDAPVPLWAMFHGANGSANDALEFLESHAHRHKFLLLLPQSTYATWDLVMGGNGPDLERLNLALSKVAARFLIDTKHFGFCGFSDGGSYALSIGASNGDLISHIIVMSGGFMNAYQPVGKPLVFIAHSPEDQQLPIDRTGRKHATMLKQAGYDVEYHEFGGSHAIHPHVVEQAVEFFLKRRPL